MLEINFKTKFFNFLSFLCGVATVLLCFGFLLNHNNFNTVDYTYLLYAAESLIGAFFWRLCANVSEIADILLQKYKDKQK